MERKTSLVEATQIMGENFIGPQELKSIELQMGIFVPNEILEQPPHINLSESLLQNNKNDYILILGIPFYKDKTPLTIVKMRRHFGWKSNLNEPCMYNQDWYLNELFALEKSFLNKWYLVRKSVYENFRGHEPNSINNNLIDSKSLPSAVLLTYLFFVNYFVKKGEILWENDYLWCNDIDKNGDQIYVGRYCDPNSINKNGFNIHRHLKIRNNYTAVDLINSD